MLFVEWYIMVLLLFVDDGIKILVFGGYVLILND